MNPDWNGAQGEYWVQQQERQDAVLAPFIPRILEAAQIGPEDRVLDIGCGCGATTRAAARAATGGRVLGVDISEPMLDVARRLATDDGLTNIEFMQANAQTASLGDPPYDVMISRFGVMFFDDASAAFANLATALTPGARVAFVCWQPAKANPHISLPMRAIVKAFPDAVPRDAPQPPFSMADASIVRDLLSGSGFGDIDVIPVTGPLRIGDDIDDVMRHFQSQPMAKDILAGRDPAQVDEVLGHIRNQLGEHASADGVFLDSAAWLVTAARS